LVSEMVFGIGSLNGSKSLVSLFNCSQDASTP
jgi:hypothetical protein